MDRLDVWPVFGLRVRTPELELRPVDPDLAFDVAALAAEGIHDPAVMPFCVPWTDAEPPELQRGAIRHYHETWASFRPAGWHLPLGVFEGTTLVGVQSLRATEFPALREVDTGSWVGRRFQGRGIGRAMRAAALHLAFAGLGARRARSEAFTDNPASHAVSRALGYRPDGTRWVVRRGGPAEITRLTLDRAEWRPHRFGEVTVAGLDERTLAFLGLTGTDPR